MGNKVTFNGIDLDGFNFEITNAVDHMAPVVDAHTDRIAALEAHVAVQALPAHIAAIPPSNDHTAVIVATLGPDRMQWNGNTLGQAILAARWYPNLPTQQGIAAVQAEMVSAGWVAPVGVSGDFSLAAINAANPVGAVTPSPAPAPVPSPIPVSPGVVDATGWLPGNISTTDRLCHGGAGQVVSYRFSAAQLRDGNPTKQGKISLYECPPAQFEISNQPGSMNVPLPVVPGDVNTFLSPARMGVGRFPDLNYINADHPGNPSWASLAFAVIGEPDANGFYYVNVKLLVDGEYFLWYWKQ